VEARDKNVLDREFSDFYREHLRDVYNYTYYRTGNHHDAEIGRSARRTAGPCVHG
jgi:DNA-directed RNA polymerase specialized sigma24 family protein